MSPRSEIHNNLLLFAYKLHLGLNCTQHDSHSSENTMQNTLSKGVVKRPIKTITMKVKTRIGLGVLDFKVMSAVKPAS